MKTNEQIKVKLKSSCAGHDQIGKSEDKAPLILTSTPGSCGWSASSSERFLPGK